MKPEPRLRLIEARKHRQWSQQEVANRLGTTQHNVSRWERGATTPTTYFQAQLCALFEKTPQQLGLVEQTPQFSRASAATNADPAPTQEPSAEEASTLWEVPYPRNRFFTGRDPLLEALHQQLVHKHRAALSQSMVLSGLGGIGKTQTALEYAYRHVHDYTALFWIEAETAERLVSSFMTLAETLDLPERLESEKPRVVSAVLRWLTTHQGWLLIFDNVEDLEVVKPFVPTVPHGSILLTTRLQAVGTLAGLLTVETMGLTEGTLFLLRRARLLPSEAFLDDVSSELLAEAEALVIELDFLPLALDQAGAYIEEVGCSLATYLELYHSRRKDLLQRRGHTPSDHPESVVTTWSLSFHRIEQHNPAAADLLRMCAFLEPDAIPEELLQEGCLTLGSLMHAVATDLLAFHGACEELSRFSLVQRDQEARLLRVHRLVQAVLKDAMETGEQERWVEHMLRATERVFPATVDASSWPVCQRMLPQAQMGSVWVQRFAVASAPAASLLLRTARYLRDVALYEQAECLNQQVLSIHERMLTHEHLEMAHSLHELAEVSRQRGNYAEAEPLYQRALDLLEPRVGKQHLDIANILQHLADLYRMQGRHAETEPLYQRALSIREHHLGPDHPQVAQSLNGLAGLHLAQGQYAKAEPLFQRALSILEQRLGPEHPQVASPLNNLALVSYRQGRYGEAEPLFQRALSIWERHLGPEHPEVASPLNNLAHVYWKQGRYGEAEPLFQRALSIREHSLGREHPLVASPLHGLAHVYWRQGRYGKAEPLYRRALSIREQHLGPEHPEVASPLHGLACLYGDQGRYGEAESLFQRVLSIWEQLPGPEHPEVAYVLSDLAELYLEQGRYAKAEPLYQRALSVLEQHLGPDHPHMASPLQGLAHIYNKQGWYAKAEPLYQRALRMREQHLGPEHPETAETLHDIATLRERQGNREEARALYQRALTIREQALGAAHPKTMKTRTRLISLLHAMGQQEEVE